MSSDDSYLILEVDEEEADLTHEELLKKRSDADSKLIDEDWIRELENLENENVNKITSRNFPLWPTEHALLKVKVADGMYKYVVEIATPQHKLELTEGAHDGMKLTMTSNVHEAAKFRVEGNADGVFFLPEIRYDRSNPGFSGSLEFSRKSIGEKSYLIEPSTGWVWCHCDQYEFMEVDPKWESLEVGYFLVEVEIVAGGTFYKAYQWITSKLRPTENPYTELDYEAYTKIACFYDAWLRDPAGLIEVMQTQQWGYCDWDDFGWFAGTGWKGRFRLKWYGLLCCRSRTCRNLLPYMPSFIRILGIIVCCLGLPFAYGSFMLDACTDEQFADSEASCDVTAFLQSRKALLLVPVSGLLVLLVSVVIKSLVYVGACASPQKAAAFRRFLTKHFYDVLVIQKLPNVVGTPETICIMLYFSEAVAFLLLALKQKSVAALALVPAVTNMFMVIADAVLGRPVYVGLAEKLKLKDMLAECIDEVESENQGMRQTWNQVTTTGPNTGKSITGSCAILLAEIIRLKDHGGTGSRNAYMPFMMKCLDPSYPDQRGLAQVEKSEIVRSLERLLMHSPDNPEFQIPRWVALALSSWMPEYFFNSVVPLRLHLFYDHETGISADLDALAVQKWGRASGKGCPSRRQIVAHFFLKLTKFIAAVKALGLKKE